MKTMKTISRAFVWVIFITLLTSCNEDKETLTLTVPVKPDAIEFTVSEMTPDISVMRVIAEDTDMKLFETTLNTRLGDYLEKQGSSYNNIRKFSLAKVEVKAKDPANYDMSGFVGMKLYFGEEQELVAEAKSVSSDKKTLNFEISIDNLDKYSKTDNLKVLIKGPNPVSVGSVLLAMQLEFAAKIAIL